MSDRPIDVKLKDSTDVRLNSENTQPTPDDFQKRLARVLDRGWAVDRLTMENPPGFWGEWIPKDDASQARAQILGFQQAPEELTKSRALNNDGTKSGIGDVVYMVQPIWMHEMIEKKRSDDYKKNHLNTKQQREEKDFLLNNAKLDMPAHASSDAVLADGNAIKEALKPQTTG